MNRLIRTLALCLVAGGLGLQAQELPSRVGLNLYVAKAEGDLGDVSNGGWCASLPIYFNRDGVHEGRLRIDLIGMPGKDVRIQAYGQTVSYKIDTAGVGVGYDWMPRLAGSPTGASFNLILGIGGISWGTRYTDSLGQDITDSSVAISPTAGIAARFNRHVGLEARYTWSKVTNSSDPYLVDLTANHFLVGLNFRF